MLSKMGPGKRLCNVVPSRATERDWTMAHALAAGVLRERTELPETVDLRAPWWTVNDQGETGSCVGWASADGVVRYHMVAAGRLEQSAMLSPRFVWMASKETDEYTSRPETFLEGAGTSLKSALDVCRKFGAVTTDVLPFEVRTLMYTGEDDTFYAQAAQRRITAYFNLGNSPAKWRRWLASHGPVLAALNVDETWDNATSTQGVLDTFVSSTARGGHAVAIVGYTKDRFIVRNSWGAGWGDNGFAYASDTYVKAAFSNESYGVTV